MDPMNEGQNPGRRAGFGGFADLSTIQAIAEALRSEFVDAIDAHPGGVRIKAGSINLALRIVTWIIMKDAAGVEDDDADAVQTWLLRQVALGRLHEAGVMGSPAERLLDSEPTLGDAWIAYVALAPETVIDDLMGRMPKR